MKRVTERKNQVETEKMSLKVLEEVENLPFKTGQVVPAMEDMRGKDFQSFVV